jgi:hypothetical protein
MRGLHRPRGKTAPPEGIGLAFLALAIQILLPFLVAFEITLARTPAYAESKSPICSASGSTTSPAHLIDHTAHHGLADGCPICLALAASQAFTAAAPVALPLPQAALVLRNQPALTPPLFGGISASYRSRAPPVLA